MANPKITYPIKKLLPLTDELAQRITNYRFNRRVASENEAMRQLIELGLETAEKQKEKANG